jgi:hypothetical protein
MMIALKICLSVNQALELKAKVKLESSSPENNLPFDKLVIEALPSTAENPELQLQITNSGQASIKNAASGKFFSNTGGLKKAWWQRLLSRGNRPSLPPVNQKTGESPDASLESPS